MNNYLSGAKTVRAQSSPNNKSKLPWILGCLGATAVVLILVAAAGIAYFSSTRSSKSIVLIREPADNAALYIGEGVPLRAIARDDQKVKQVELWVNDILISYENSDIAGGISPFPLITSWIPTQSGVYTISARSTNTKGKQSVSQIQVTIFDNQDTDGDQIPDHLDNCPEQAGTEQEQGCMDRDFDGIPDEIDACPDAAGLPENGCPAPSENDRDGDGFLNDMDTCPDEVGSPSANGCPDRDGDGFADREDECPDEAGIMAACPSTGDADSDGVMDGDDACPTAWGLPELAGCSDEDGDGIVDHEDVCPSTAGIAANGGCPDMGGVLPLPPTPDDDDDPPEEGGIFDGLNPEPVPKAIVPVEIEAYTMYIRNEYEFVTCYLDIGDIFDNPPRQFEFESNGTQYWDIADQLDGENSISTFAEDEDTLDITLECLGHSGVDVETLVDMTVSHPSPEWDGSPQQIRTDSSDFSVAYHICSPNCAESDLATPYFHAITMGPRGEGPYIAHWEWDGNEDEIDGFMVALVRQFDVPTIIQYYHPDARSLEIDDIEPACGETIELVIRAFKNEEGTDRVSRNSNSQIWTSREACRHTAMVTFQFLDVHNLPGDQGNSNSVGPLEGTFYVSNGSDIQALGFDGIWRSPNGYLHDGLKIQSGTYLIQDLFDWINRKIDSCLGNGCHSNSYRAPNNDFMVIEFDQREDLIVGADITDDDTGRNDDDTFFSGQTTVVIEDYDSPMPQWVTIEGEFANIRAIIQILPED